MASTAGLSAWSKYFKGKGNVSTVVKKRTGTYLPNGKIGPVLEQGTTVIVQELKNEKDYLGYVRGKGTGPKVNAHVPVKVGTTVVLCSLDDLAKPREGTVIDLKLQTVHLVAGAPTQSIDLMGYKNIKSAVFTSGSQLRRIVAGNLNTNKLLDTVPAFKKSMLDYFKGTDSSKIKWMGMVGDGEKAQFAKYVGELVIGLALLENKSVIAGGTNPFAGKRIKEFIVPLDESFPGADSVIRLSDGKLVPISSKADSGAKASFFANILAPLIKHPEYFSKKSVIKDIFTAAKAVGVVNPEDAGRSAKKIVYEYGVRNVLKISASQLSNSYQLFEEFKKYDKLTQYSPAVRIVYGKLKHLIESKDDETALKNLDSSTTVFFSKMIAEQLNKDAASNEIVAKVLGSKSYYQANMDVASLKSKGTIQFTMVLSGEAKVNFIGTKSAYTNLDASQGTVNYELKRVR